MINKQWRNEHRTLSAEILFHKQPWKSHVYWENALLLTELQKQH